MDVNDLGGNPLPIDITKEPPSGARVTSPADQTQSSKTEQTSPAISVEVTSATSVQASDLRNRANEIINVVNIVSTATDEIETLIDSVGGIIEQAKTPNLSGNKLSILQNEANQLIEEIKAKAYSTESHGVRPLLGDTVRFEVEQKYGDALEIILPDTAKDAFGLGHINISMKDSIISTLTRVEQAKKQFEALRSSVDTVTTSVRKSVDTLEVALQNSEASKATIRSVDQALTLATSTHSQIGNNPKQALESFSKLNLDSATLLRS